MKIDELDEWQGLTPEHINDWLHAHGWQQTKPRWWEKGEDGFLFDPQTFDQVWFWLYALAAVHNTNIQGMLREINPRWRKGFPSNAALAEHDEWLIRAPWGAEFVAHISYGGSDDGYMIMIPPDSESGDCGGIEESVWGDCFYWPCDGNANRVRWPVDAEGKML